MATAALARRLGASVKDAGAKKGSGWYSSHMAAASRAILERIPLVDFTLEIRDARIPISSAYEDLRDFPPSSRRIIVLNKTDLADRRQTKFLNFIQARVRELKKDDQLKYTTTIMLVGIPNVGKSSLANSLHQIGRISAAEKGKLKHTIVSPLPGETKDISSLKIGSHPNIYVLDTPGVLHPSILDVEMGSKLVLTGAISDSLVEECEIAEYFLSILNTSNEYKHWENLLAKEDEESSRDHKTNFGGNLEVELRRRKQYLTDHTQDFIVRDVRRTLFESISSFKGNLEDEKELSKLIKVQFIALQEAFHIPLGSAKDINHRVALKLLNLYRTGRLGHYTLDPIPRNAK
ncbi:PREDICTED: DAR GTPase 2, mitochondrial isoform X2 [Nelumbo nucifera]|uniref:DAR GTPase 2, mitochondrial isoform X2 n=1 Tax=Nelumbo nucifera TaxID=4432 RepID=A0A1U8Q9S1_NELNU|nr:PREDICTED: DAR GTPase 2, mitochondrial isoform X2 [Nelumbo nucifera]